MKTFVSCLCILALAAIPAFAYENSASDSITIPEVIWADATGGGIWFSLVQITSLTDGTNVDAYFYYGGGGVRGPFRICENLARLNNEGFYNMLNALDHMDFGDFVYKGRVGALVLVTQDASHLIHANVRTMNGNYSKTFQGVPTLLDGSTAAVGRPAMIQQMADDSDNRTFAGFFNASMDPVTVEFRLTHYNGVLLGPAFTRTFVGSDFQFFNPFVEAGVPYPLQCYDNAVLQILPQSGAGRLIGFGSSANNYSNDPSAHLMVHFE